VVREKGFLQPRFLPISPEPKEFGFFFELAGKSVALSLQFRSIPGREFPLLSF